MLRDKIDGAGGPIGARCGTSSTVPETFHCGPALDLSNIEGKDQLGRLGGCDKVHAGHMIDVAATGGGRVSA